MLVVTLEYHTIHSDTRFLPKCYPCKDALNAKKGSTRQHKTQHNYEYLEKSGNGIVHDMEFRIHCFFVLWCTLTNLLIQAIGAFISLAVSRGSGTVYLQYRL